MEINYDLIIKYLVKKDTIKSPNDSFLTQKNNYNYSTGFPIKFKEIFTDKFYRYGITVYDNNKSNISFWSSLLTLIDPSFMVPYNSDELNMINSFKNQLIDSYNKNKVSLIVKELDKNDIRERFKLEPDHIILQYIVDILDINFLFFDFVSYDISYMYRKDIMNPWKQTFMFAKYNSLWEPIMSVRSKDSIQRSFDYNDEVIKRALSLENQVSYYEGQKVSKEFCYISNLDDVIQNEKVKLKIKLHDITNITDSTDVFIKSDISACSDSLDTTNTTNVPEDYMLLNKNKLTKMKLSDLNDIITKLSITSTSKKITKAILIELILEKIGNRK